MSSTVVFRSTPPKASAGLRRQWALWTLAGLLVIALVGLAVPRSLGAALAVWGYCSFLLLRHLDENVREGERGGAPLPTLGAPTLVTMLRGLLLALAAGFFRVPEVVAPAYGLAAILDHADGRIARFHRRETRLGARLDMEVDAVGILVATVAGIALGKLPTWYLSVGLARYLFVGGLFWRSANRRPSRELDRRPLRRALAGFQMGFLAVAMWPPIAPDVTHAAAYLFGGASLAMFVRDWLYVSGRLALAAADPTAPSPR